MTESAVLRVYHRTSHFAAVLRDGFRDSGEPLVLRGADTDEPVEILPGIWVSAQWPLDENEGAGGDAVIELTIPMELFEKYEWVEADKPYRESMIPAAELNAFKGSARLLSEDEIDALTRARWGFE